MKTVYVSHSKRFDFRKELYIPLIQLRGKYNLVLPYEASEFFDAPALINTTDNLAVIAELSFPSLVRDSEISLAFANERRVVGIYRKGAAISRAQSIACSVLLEYETLEKIIPKIEKLI